MVVTTWGRAASHQGVGARDVTKHPITHRTVSETKNHPAPNVTAAEVENLALWPPSLGKIKANQVCTGVGLDLDADPLGLGCLLALSFLAVRLWQSYLASPCLVFLICAGCCEF